MKSLVVIPARGGSKGIPMKNIYPLCGKPLLEYTIETVIRAKINGEIAVSSDSDEILQVAAKYPEVICIKRPNEISGDCASTEDALLQALKYMEREYEKNYEAVITMQPTSPLRKVETITKFLENYKWNLKKFDAQLTVTESRSDYWVINEQGDFERMYKDAPRRRQERNPVFIENSAIYITEVNALKSTRSVLGTHANGFVISEVEGIDINEFTDIKLAEFYLQYQENKKYNRTGLGS